MSDPEKLAKAEQRAEKAERLFTESTIQRALHDAAVKHDAFNPSQIITVLKPSARLTQAGDGQFEVQVVTREIDPATGQEVETACTPDEAVARMKQNRKENENLFNSVLPAPAAPAPAGKIDVRKLTHEEFLKIRAEHPEWLGLAPKRR